MNPKEKKTGVVVGGKLQLVSSMQMVNLLKTAGTRIKAIDPLGTDIEAIAKRTNNLDYLLLDAQSSIGTRLRLIKCLRHIRCNIILFRLHKDVTKTKFYKLYTQNKELNEEFDGILKEYFNTRLREPCGSKRSKIKYNLYLMEQSFLDFRERWARRYYLSHL